MQYRHQTLVEHHFGDGVRIFEYLFVRFGRTDTGYDTLAYTCKYGLFTGTSYKLFDVGTYCHEPLQ